MDLLFREGMIRENTWWTCGKTGLKLQTAATLETEKGEIQARA